MTWAEQLGKGEEVTFGVDTTIYPWSAKCYTGIATAGGLKLKVPPESSPFLKTGLQCMVWNAGANAFDVTKSDNTVLTSVAIGEICRVTFHQGTFKAKIL